MKNKREHIEQLYDKYSKNVYYTALRIIGREQESEDIMQNSFIKYYNHIINHPDKIIDNPLAWLKSVCIRESIDILRKKEKEFLYREEHVNSLELEQREEKELEGELYTLFNSNNKEILVEKIKRCLQLLPAKCRTVLSLSLFEGYDNQEIAQILNISESGVRSQYKRGKEKLIKELKEN